MATPDDLRRRYLALRVWSGSRRRAPHKPLLALWAIGRCLRGDARMAPFELVDRELAALLRSFGPPRKAIHTEFPFWRLRGDGVWELDRPHLATLTASGDARRASLRKADMRGGLPEADYEAFRANPRLAREVAEALADAHFPPTYRDDLLQATGIVGAAERRADVGSLEARDEEWDPLYDMAWRRRRDPAFRPAVLRAYSARCAVCAFDVRLADQPVAVEAAHIHWHSDAGPTDVHNGMALCVMHHRLFDRGAFTVLPNYEVFVCDKTSGKGADEALGRFHAEPLRVLPKRLDQRPAPRYLRWHASEVFRAPDAVPGR